MKGTVVQVGDAALKCCPCPTGWQGRDRYTMRSGAMHVCRDVRTMSVGELSERRYPHHRIHVLIDLQ